MVAGNSKIDIGISFKPIEICDFNLVLECIAKEKNPKGTFSTSGSKKGTDQKVMRVVCPKGYGQSYWATRNGDTYTRIERMDMELR